MLLWENWDYINNLRFSFAFQGWVGCVNSCVPLMFIMKKRGECFVYWSVYYEKMEKWPACQVLSPTVLGKNRIKASGHILGGFPPTTEGASR